MSDMKEGALTLNVASGANLSEDCGISSYGNSSTLAPEAHGTVNQLVQREAHPASENADEVDEEDLQEDELQELEDDEDEEAEIEENSLLSMDSSQEHPGLLCRLCAEVVDTAHFIFSEEGKKEKMYDKINTSLPVSVS